MRNVIRITRYLGKDGVVGTLTWHRCRGGTGAVAQVPWRGVGRLGKDPETPAGYHKRTPDEFGRLLKNVTNRNACNTDM